MDYKIDELASVESEFAGWFCELASIQAKIKNRLGELSGNEKTLKGDELVGWLGEIYTAKLLSAKLVDDSHEYDVVTDCGMRVSVKARRGQKSGWNRSSAIPKIEELGESCPTHFMFVHLDENCAVESMWLYNWEELVRAGRFKKHTVRGNFRSFYFSVSPSKDKQYLKYQRGSN